jgi:hypothetical protein
MKLIYSDIIKPILVKDFDNFKYFVTFEYNKIKLAIIYYIKSKKEIINYFIYFKKHFERVNLG